MPRGVQPPLPHPPAWVKSLFCAHRAISRHSGLTSLLGQLQGLRSVRREAQAAPCDLGLGRCPRRRAEGIRSQLLQARLARDWLSMAYRGAARLRRPRVPLQPTLRTAPCRNPCNLCGTAARARAPGGLFREPARDWLSMAYRGAARLRRPRVPLQPTLRTAPCRNPCNLCGTAARARAPVVLRHQQLTRLHASRRTTRVTTTYATILQGMANNGQVSHSQAT